MDTIVTLIEESCRRFRDRTAFLQKRGGLWREIDYETLSASSDRIAAGLAENGFRAGEHAALLAASSPQWVMAYLGILKTGGVVVPIDKELKEVEVRHILAHSDTHVLFVDGDHLDMVLALADGLPLLRSIVMVGEPDEGAARHPGTFHGSILTLDALTGKGTFSPIPRQPHDTALILYTSGTTGRSKGAMLSHANIVSNIRGAALHLRVDQTVHTLSFLPINHVFEQVCGILLPLSLGGKVSFCESLKKLGENLAEVKPTFFVGVPAVYRLILGRIMKRIDESAITRLLYANPFTRPIITSRIRSKLGAGTVFISGGAALDPAIVAGFARFGATLLQGYGITETSPVIAAEAPHRARHGTVGRILDGIDVKIDNPDDDMVGEILVRGPNVMQGYFKDPLATAEAISDGWYRTGDLGRFDGDGFLTICGRVKSLIVTPNGKNIYPEEVEIELLKSPFIAEVVVYGNRLTPAEEEIHAIIYPDREAFEEYVRREEKAKRAPSGLEQVLRAEVRAACSGLAAFKRVRTFTIREEEFPKTTTRKIKRFEVAEGLKGQVPAEVGQQAGPGSLKAGQRE